MMIIIITIIITTRLFCAAGMHD